MLITNGGLTGMAAEPADSYETESVQETLNLADPENETEPESADTQDVAAEEPDTAGQEDSDDTERPDGQLQTELKENSWRYSDGELILDQEPAAYSLDAWTKVNGYFVNDIGEVIPNAVKKGLDVSHHQGEIDWEAVKNSDIEFVIIRCGFGDDSTSQDDRYWLRNVQECERLGIPYGVYLYSYATTTANARSEAKHVLRLLEGHNPSYPVYFDMEDNSTLVSKSQFAEFADIFCSAVEAAGYEAGVYANLSWWNTYLTDTRFSKWDRWVAQYNSQCSYQGEYSMWQCTSNGTVPGIDGPADLNFLIQNARWEEENGNKYYYVDGEKITNQGMKIDGCWYYFGSDGAAYCSQWREKDGTLYYYDAEGHMVSNQGMKIDDYWYYFETSGVMLRGWRDKGADRYYYDADGRMVSGKGLKIGDYWYYFETSGVMLRGWRDKGADRYYYDADGRMVSNQGMKIDDYWYYFEKSGVMLRGWRDKGADRYYYDADGRMVSGKGLKIGDYWYYFEKSGMMLRGWRDKGSDRYYYDEDGKMVADQYDYLIGETLYSFDKSGKLI